MVIETLKTSEMTSEMAASQHSRSTEVTAPQTWKQKHWDTDPNILDQSEKAAPRILTTAVILGLF